ncbi:MAG: GTP-binding protein [Desulfobacterales bacterium]
MGSRHISGTGFVQPCEGPERRYVYQQIGTRWSLEPGAAWVDDRRRTLLVVIGRKGFTRNDALGALIDCDKGYETLTILSV